MGCGKVGNGIRRGLEVGMTKGEVLCRDVHRPCAAEQLQALELSQDQVSSVLVGWFRKCTRRGMWYDVGDKTVRNLLP